MVYTMFCNEIEHSLKQIFYSEPKIDQFFTPPKKSWVEIEGVGTPKCSNESNLKKTPEIDVSRSSGATLKFSAKNLNYEKS